MKSYYTFSCPKIVFSVFLRIILISLIYVFGLLLFFDFNILNNFVLPYTCVMLGALFWRIFGYWKSCVINAFIIVKVDSAGVTTRYCSLKWADISYITFDILKEPYPKLLREFDYGMLICLGETPSTEINSFWTYEKQNMIFLPKNDIILKFVSQYGKTGLFLCPDEK